MVEYVINTPYYVKYVFMFFKTKIYLFEEKPGFAK